MELKGSKTEKNLQAAFAGESQARNKYTKNASVAKKAGYEQIKAFFEETANNEKEHAKIWFKLLNGGELPNDINALKQRGAIPEGYTVNHFLTDTNGWYLMTDVPNGMKHFERIALQNSMDGDFDTGNVRYKARERYSFGWSDPLGMWGSAGA